jgi:3,4-dihydroxy 2-butanone 4-phosphate synthase/GTP cyclohydrolase II
MLMDFSGQTGAKVVFPLSEKDDRAGRVEAALHQIARGGLVVVTDDDNRENEGDLICAADRVTPETVAFMVNHTTGILCAAMEDATADALDLPLMVLRNTDPHSTAFTLTCDSLDAGTGVSAEDRTKTLRYLADPVSTPDGLRRPGHIFPLRAKRRGVFARDGHTEAAYDLCRLAGCAPVGVLSELVEPSGEMLRGAALVTFAMMHGLPMLSVRDLIAWRRDHEMVWIEGNFGGLQI